MTAPFGQLRRAVPHRAPVWLFGTFSWTNCSPRIVVRAMAAVTSAGMRTSLSNVSVTLARSPASAMLLTEPTGTSASCTWAAAGQVADVAEVGGGRALRRAAADRAAGRGRRRARAARGRRGGGGGGGAAHQNQLATSWAHCESRPRWAWVVRVRPWFWGSGGSSVGGGRGQRRAGFVAAADVDGSASAIDALWRRRRRRSPTAGRRGRCSSSEPLRSTSDEPEEPGRAGLQPRSDVSRLHGWVVVVVVGGTVVVVVGPGPELFGALDDDGAGVVVAPARAPRRVLDLLEALLQQRLRRGRAALPRQRVDDRRDGVDEGVEEARRRVAAVGRAWPARPRRGRCAWLDARRRQMPASRSRSRPAR